MQQNYYCMFDGYISHIKTEQKLNKKKMLEEKNIIFFMSSITYRKLLYHVTFKL